MKKFIKGFFKFLFFVLLISFAVSLILFGLYYSKISKKQYAFGLLVDQVFDKTEEIFQISSRYQLGDTFTIEGTFDMDLSSEDYQNKSASDSTYFKKNQLLKNLSNMDTTFHFQHDRENEKAYLELNEKIGEEEIFAGKYLLDNSTEYYFVNGILQNYVNDGSNNYFESFGEESDTGDNLTYLSQFIRDSIKKNVGEEDLKGYDVETLIGNETQSVGQVSFRITDKRYKALLKSILKDLKSDQRASQILSLAFPNLQELKVDEKKKYLKSNESYTINIYLSKFFFQPLKYEVIYLKDDQKEIYTYEGDFEDGLFYYSVNNELKYRANVQSTQKKMDITVYNQYEKEVGTIKLEKDRDNLMFVMTLELEDTKYDVTYTMKNKDYQKNQYVREGNLIFKEMKDKVVTLQGNLLLESKVTKGAKIEEDLTSSVLESSLTTEEKDSIEKLRETIQNRLEK